MEIIEVKEKSRLLVLVIALLLVGCASIPKYANIQSYDSIRKYDYVYVTPAGTKNSVSGSSYGNQFGTYGTTSSKSINPAEIISGRFMKAGMVPVPELRKETNAKTIVVNYSETGRHNKFMGYSIEVTIQLIDAATYDVICTATAEGMGDTETDDVRKAINKCMDAILNDVQ